MSDILYYVSSHGFGHAARSAQVISELTESAGMTVTVRTMAPSWIFPAANNGAVTVEEADVDTGLIQSDSLTVDIRATVQSWETRQQSLKADIRQELEAVDRLDPKVIVCDIAPLGVETAVAAGIPSVVVANFLWDWILAAYGDKEPRLREIAGDLRDTYSKAGTILRTPLSGGFEGLDNVTGIPLITRKSRKSRSQARQSLGLPENEGLALVSVGGIGLERFSKSLASRIKNHGLMFLGDGPATSGRIYSFGRNTANHPDLLAACDIVLGKMGYGLCAELIATRRPMLYTSRPDFVECSVLEEGTAEFVTIKRLTEKEFFEGELDRFIESAISVPHPDKKMALDGAAVAASVIAGLAKTG